MMIFNVDVASRDTGQATCLDLLIDSSSWFSSILAGLLSVFLCHCTVYPLVQFGMINILGAQLNTRRLLPPSTITR